ncbi:MAG: carboxylesterase family protein [Ruminococcaceae bacterium]|nr:carboxylesterase family protein [Oscillospiraceae bacterium]
MLRVTKTETGMVRGFPGTDARITVFKGIPFAADPSGENRWRAPQPAASWEGVRDCYDFAPITMQGIPGANPDAFYSKEWHVDPEIPMAEDGSLAVNIWTPAKSADEKLPVMVWIFGGGLQEGYCCEMEFNGERIAHRGVVLVTVAYRLNVFGFLAHPELTAEAPDAPCNFGFLDQKAAIEWVGRNIANFGGDPDNITIFGQSSGGVSVFTQMCSEQTKGLFHKAIVMSAAGGSVLPAYPKTAFNHNLELKEAEELGVRFFREYLGVETLAEARALPAEFVRDKALEVRGWFSSVVDHKFLTKEIEAYLLANEVHDVPLMVGWTGDEMLLGPQENTAEALEEYAKSRMFDKAEEYTALVKQIAGEGGDFVKAAVVNPNETAARNVAGIFNEQGRKVYIYNFDPEIPGDNAGAFHSCDLWFCFETLMKCWRPFDGHHYDLARKMCNYWTNFAKNGDPNGLDADGTAMPTWEAYTPENPRCMEFFDTISMQRQPLSPIAEYIIKTNREAYREMYQK